MNFFNMLILGYNLESLSFLCARAREERNSGNQPLGLERN